MRSTTDWASSLAISPLYSVLAFITLQQALSISHEIKRSGVLQLDVVRRSDPIERGQDDDVLTTWRSGREAQPFGRRVGCPLCGGLQGPALSLALPPALLVMLVGLMLMLLRCPPCRRLVLLPLACLPVWLPGLPAPPLVVGVVVPLSFFAGVVLALALVLALGLALVPFTGRAFGRLVLVVADVLPSASARWSGACSRVEDGLLKRGDVCHDFSGDLPERRPQAYQYLALALYHSTYCSTSSSVPRGVYSLLLVCSW